MGGGGDPSRRGVEGDPTWATQGGRGTCPICSQAMPVLGSVWCGEHASPQLLTIPAASAVPRLWVLHRHGGFKQAQVPASGAATPELLMDGSP